jgi:hypothetical protein
MSQNITADLAHARFGHIKLKRLFNSKECTVGLNIHVKTPAKNTNCNLCSITKAKYNAHKLPGERRVYKILEMVALDYKGPI